MAGSRGQRRRASIPTRCAHIHHHLLTSLTTFVGLLPIQLETAIQAQFVKPMATSVAFGVLFATMVTLVLVPVLYFVGRDIRALFGAAPAEAVTEN